MRNRRAFTLVELLVVIAIITVLVALLLPASAHFLLGDGSVRFVNESVNQSLYQALSTINGGETIGEY